MLEILSRSGCFIIIIFLGYFLKKIGIFKDSDFHVLSNIVLKITLPAVIISNFANKELDPSVFIFALLSFLFGCTYVLLGYLFNIKRSPEQQAFEMLNYPGYNIGCFALPFVQSFLGPGGMIATFLFDIGNAFVTLGGAYSIASMVKDGNKFSLKRIVRTLLKSVPFILYLVMPTLCLLHIPIPGMIISLAEIVGSANAFLSMLMVGVGFKLVADKTQIGAIARVLSVRFGFAFVFALICYLLPFSMDVRKALILLVFSPMGTAILAFTGEMKSNVGLSSAINSISILCSLVFMVMILVIIP